MFEPRKKTQAELAKDLRMHLSFLNDFILEYDRGKAEYYKNVAKELHILLCDINYNRIGEQASNNSLVPRIFPDIALHPLSYQPDVERYKNGKTKLIAFLPGKLTFNTEKGIAKFSNLFDTGKGRIQLSEWLKQYLHDFTITIEILIRSVRDKNGGAHVDDGLNRTLVKTSSSIILGSKEHIFYIVEIGRYIYREIGELLAESFNEK